jgi:hypothetical protein
VVNRLQNLRFVDTRPAKEMFPDLRLILCLFIRLQINVYILRYPMSFETMGQWHSSDTPGSQLQNSTFTSSRTHLALPVVSKSTLTP